VRRLTHARFAFALFLSLALHATLAGLLRGGGAEPVPLEAREISKIMRISLAALPSSAPAAQVITSQHPEAGQPKQSKTSKPPPQNQQNQQKAPSQTVEKREPSVIKSVNAQGDDVQRDNVQDGNAQQGRTHEATPALAPDSGGIGGSMGAIVDASRLRVTKKVPAEYPMISRRRKDHGTVVLILNIRSGRVTKAEVEKSSGHAALDESAKKAVSAWEFDASGFGESLSARISFVFSLTDIP